MSSLDSLRQRIDDADRDLLAALSRRMEVVDHILQQKESQRLPLFDTCRERELLARLANQASRHRLDPKLVERVLREVISHSREVQARRVQERRNPDLKKATRVAFQGAVGAYSWSAVGKHFRGNVQPVGLPGFREVVEALQGGQVDLALLPIENTLAGSIHEVYDLLAASRMHVIGEEVLKIEHCLAGLRDVPLEEIRRVLSHPVALQQCGAFLRGLPNAACQAYIDTAEAVREVKRRGDEAQAAIASRDATHRYGLKVLREGISDHPENYTRFWVVSRRPVQVDPRLPAKTSLLLVTDHRQGALVACLTALTDQGVNMTKLESRPRPGSPWQYQFYLDVEGNLDSQAVQKALERIRQRARLLRVLGCYPRFEARSSVPQLKHVRGNGRSEAVPPRSTSSKPTTRRGVRRPLRVSVKDVEIGDGAFAILAGPSVFSSPDQLDQAAALVDCGGGHILLAGDYQGQDDGQGKAAEWIAETGRRHGLPVAFEVHSPSEVAAAARWADLLVAGASNMQNYPLLREAGRQAQPVLLERGLSSTLEELLQAARQIMAEGNQQVLLCERGIRTFAGDTLDLGAVVELKRRTHLPVLVAPNLAARSPSAVIPLSRAARAAGADGLLIRVQAGNACDSSNSLDQPLFVRLVEEAEGS